eukprot:3183421-Prymnesium_polylepis.1
MPPARAAGHTAPPLSELDLDGVLHHGISPSTASVFLSQISPTQLSQPHLFDVAAAASLDGAGPSSGAKASPFDFSSALQVRAHAAAHAAAAHAHAHARGVATRRVGMDPRACVHVRVANTRRDRKRDA